jgi:hypothetical protein
MACGSTVRIPVPYWSVCWWGIFPYPCRKTHTETRYEYHFLPWRTRNSWVPFGRQSYEGCCGGKLYAWSTWSWSGGTFNGQWTDTTWDYLSDVGLDGGVYPCPFKSPDDLGER